jgi:hypothetical protein
MPGTLGTCSYPGLNIRYASFTFSRGVTPSIATLVCTPFDGLDLPPSTLRFDYGNVSVQFPDSAIMAAFIRKRHMNKGWLWSVQVMDRRWRWAFGSISGEYNRRTPSGLIDPNNQKTPAQLAALCLNALGESGYNVSQMPEGVFPYVNWQNVNPALALASLCDYVACEVVLNHLTNKVEIWPLGVGPGTQTGFGELHQKYRYSPRNVPSAIEVHGGDSHFQNKLRLRAVGLDTDGQRLIDNLSWKPAAWNTQALHFPGVAAGYQYLAQDQLWREWRVVGQYDSSLAVPQCQETITSTDQYLLDDYLLDPAERGLDGYYRKLPYVVGGNFWPYADTPSDYTNKQWFGPTKLLADRRMVKLQDPAISLSTSGLLQEATLYLATSYRVRAVNGDVVHIVRSGNVGGSGGRLVLRRPEVFASYKTDYATSEGSPSGTANTQDTAFAEADRYVQIFQQKFNNSQVSEMTYPGIIAGNLNGVVAQSRWSCGVNREALTYACENEELDVTATPRTERRRREVLKQIAEAMA